MSVDNKRIYEGLCSEELGVPIFQRPWWLDAVAGEENWDVAIANESGSPVAALPYAYRKVFNFYYITNPMLTPMMGPWIKSNEQKQSTRLSREKALMFELIEQLPSYLHMRQNWHHSMTNWLPFFWKGFSQTTFYTYILPSLVDVNYIWNNLQSNIRSDIRKATNRFALKVYDDLPVEKFYEMNKLVFDRQNMKIPYSFDFVKRVDTACERNNARKIIAAIDSSGVCHAAVYIVWDANSAYYLMGGADPELRASGATSLCLWNAIKFASNVTSAFDFEGSMIEPIEKYFRAFGGKQTPYFSIYRRPNRLFNAALDIYRMF